MAAMEVEQKLIELEQSLSERIDRLEDQVSRLTEKARGSPQPPKGAWWKQIVGVFQDDPEFDEAMRLGRAYRESLRPAEDGADEKSA